MVWRKIRLKYSKLGLEWLRDQDQERSSLGLFLDQFEQWSHYRAYLGISREQNSSFDLETRE